jgi:hypothetical protein
VALPLHMPKALPHDHEQAASNSLDGGHSEAVARSRGSDALGGLLMQL